MAATKRSSLGGVERGDSDRPSAWSVQTLADERCGQALANRDRVVDQAGPGFDEGAMVCPHQRIWNPAIKSSQV